MKQIPATQARQQWAQTIDDAHRGPVSITEHGRESVILLDAEVAHRALQALEDAQDAARAAEAEQSMHEGEETVTLDAIRRELGL